MSRRSEKLKVICTYHYRAPGQPTSSNKVFFRKAHWPRRKKKNKNKKKKNSKMNQKQNSVSKLAKSNDVNNMGMPIMYRLLGLMVRRPPRERQRGPAFEACFRRGSYSRSSHTSDVKIGTPVATLPGAWRDRVSTGTS